MDYWTNIFTADNWPEFLRNGSNRCGFRSGRENAAKKVKVGDILVCYLSGVSKFCGIVEVKSNYYIDHKPMYSDKDPYAVRFNVTPLTLLREDNAISPKIVWDKLFPREPEIPKRWCERLKMRGCLYNINDYGPSISQLISRNGQ